MKRNLLLKGFTLLEMLLVLVIAATIMGMLISYTTQTSEQNQRNKEVVQIQQILNAALAYYIQNGTWPGTASWVNLDSSHALISGNFLPKSTSASGLWLGAYLQPYQTGYDAATGNFYVINSIPTTSAAASANATIIAGQIPLGVTAITNGNPPVTPAKCPTSGGSCYVVGRVAPPGQSLATARSVNFGNVYHHGACVPAPVCPDTTHFVPEILVAATQVSGNNVASTPTATYPITSFFAYAYGGLSVPLTTTPSSSPAAPNLVADCETPNTATPCVASCTDATNPATCTAIDPTRQYWRVCLLVQTTNGQVNSTSNTAWAQYSYILAITRCAPVNENSGSNFTVWTP